MLWDEPQPKLEELTREQLLTHCKRMADWERSYGHCNDKELKAKLERSQIEYHKYGYALDKIWTALCDAGGMSSSQLDPREFISAFHRIAWKARRWDDIEKRIKDGTPNSIAAAAIKATIVDGHLQGSGGVVVHDPPPTILSGKCVALACENATAPPSLLCEFHTKDSTKHERTRY